MQTSSFLGLSVAGFHKVVYYEHGTPGGRVTLCVHGLTRTGRDFDHLATALSADGRHIICPDIVGRGKSDWLPRPELYNYPQYLADMAVLLGRLGDVDVDWIGTSMGGLMGLMLAAQPNTPIRRLVLNDIGPFVPQSALERLSTYVGQAPDFATEAELAAYIRRIHAPFGLTSEADWAELAANSTRNLPNGRFALAYDPAIGAAFKGPVMDVNLWPLYDLVRVPTLVLRGAESDLLLSETAAEMTQRGPRAQMVEFPNCGHAPALFDQSQISVVRAFLSA